MKVTKGLYSISKGKGNRYYLNVDNSSEANCQGVMHPSSIAESNGMGFYGLDELKDLKKALGKFIKKAEK